jgi:tetratricopeptide (TPR) repeat protein
MKIPTVKISVLLSFLLLTSCFELDLVNPNEMDENSFWKTENDLFQGVIAAYDALQADRLFTEYQVVLTGLSDDGTGEPTNEYYNPFRFKIFDNNIPLNEGVWINFYAMVGRSYQVIDRADQIEGPNVAAIAAEAKFLAALAYYNLVHIWGENIAYVDRIQQANDRPPRAADGELYTLMEDLLLAAIPELPLAKEYSEADYGRVSKGAAQALLAKVYMQQQRFAEAEPLLEAVVSSDQYKLLPNFADNFTELNMVNEEAVFVVNFLHGGPVSETNRNTRHQAFSPAEYMGTYGDVQPTKFIHESFLKETDKDGNPDPRFDVTIFHENSTELFINKDYAWWLRRMRNPDEINTAYFKYSEQDFIVEGGSTTEFDGGTDFILIRYADVLLLYAETLNENGKTNEAYPYVDRVRERSNMRPLAEAHPEIGNNQELFLEQLKHERVIELSGELVRFFDLKRWGMFNSSNAVRDPNFETFKEGRSEFQPLPQSELDLNSNLIQNPGY